MKNLFRSIAVYLVRMRIDGFANLLGVLRGPTHRYSLVPVRVRSRSDIEQCRRHE
jgi:hypothetical protein